MNKLDLKRSRHWMSDRLRNLPTHPTNLFLFVLYQTGVEARLRSFNIWAVGMTGQVLENKKISVRALFGMAWHAAIISEVFFFFSETVPLLLAGLALNFRPSCINIPSTEITGIYHHDYIGSV